MELGLALPHYDFSVPGEQPLRWETIADLARRAEERGYDRLYVSDHLFLDVEKYGGGEGVYGAYEPLVTLAALARTVRTARLGTLVLCEALRPAGTLARSLATLDRISGGRLDVGIGAGWYEPEYAAIGMDLPPPGERLARLREAVEVVARLFRGGPQTFDGSHHVTRDGVLLPMPLQQPRPRIVLGGKGDRLLGLVAELADGWNTVWVWEPDAWAERARALDAACDARGRDPASAWRSLGLYTLVGDGEADLAARYRRMQEQAPGGMLDGVTLDEWRRGRLVGTVEAVREQAQRWEELGVDELVACVGPLPFSVSHPDDVELAATALTGTALTGSG